MVAKRPHSLNMKEYNELEVFWREFRPMDVSGSHGFDKHVFMLLMWIVRAVHILAKNMLMLLFHGTFAFHEHFDDTTLAVWRNVMSFLCCVVILKSMATIRVRRMKFFLSLKGYVN